MEEINTLLGTVHKNFLSNVCLFFVQLAVKIHGDLEAKCWKGTVSISLGPWSIALLLYAHLLLIDLQVNEK